MWAGAPGCGRGAPPCPTGPGDCAPVFQYKVLSVLPGSGMGIAVSTPSTQKVSVRQAGGPGNVARSVPGVSSEPLTRWAPAGRRGREAPSQPPPFPLPHGHRNSRCVEFGSGRLRPTGDSGTEGGTGGPSPASCLAFSEAQHLGGKGLSLGYPGPTWLHLDPAQGPPRPGDSGLVTAAQRQRFLLPAAGVRCHGA